MTPDEEREIVRQMRAARSKARGYADFFGWPLDRDLEERQIVCTLQESLATDEQSFFGNISGRGRGNDPPDCEARNLQGDRIAIEVTELVSPAAIRSYKEGNVYDWAAWTESGFKEAVHHRLREKDKRFPKLKGAPYLGGYVAIIFSDEPMLSTEVVARYLSAHKFDNIKYLTRAFLLLSYDPGISRYPHFELALTN